VPLWLLNLQRFIYCVPDHFEAELPDWPFCGQILEIWPYFKLVGRTIFGLAVWLVFGRFSKIVWLKIFSVGRF